MVSGVALGLAGRVSDGLRYAGLVHQLLGVATVVHMLQGRRRQFKRPSLRDDAKTWLRAFPRFLPKNYTITPHSGSIHITGHAPMVFASAKVEGKSLERRIVLLEAEAANLRTWIEEGEKQAKAETERVDGIINAERSDRAAVVARLDSTIDQLGAGGIQIESMGLAWLCVGIVQATIPDELVRSFSWAWALLKT